MTLRSEPSYDSAPFHIGSVTMVSGGNDRTRKFIILCGRWLFLSEYKVAFGLYQREATLHNCVALINMCSETEPSCFVRVTLIIHRTTLQLTSSTAVNIFFHAATAVIQDRFTLKPSHWSQGNSAGTWFCFLFFYRNTFIQYHGLVWKVYLESGGCDSFASFLSKNESEDNVTSLSLVHLLPNSGYAGCVH